MTEKKTPRLPDQRYFSLEDVAKEWDKDIDHVLEQFELGRLIPSVRLPELNGRWWRSTTYPTWVDDELGWDWDGIKESSPDHVGAGVWFLPGFMYGRVHHSEDGNRYLLLEECFVSRERAPPTCWFNPITNSDASFQSISLSSLLVSREEIERFVDTENLPAAIEILTSREKDNLLRLIGALVRLYVSENGSKYGTPENVNKNQVIEALHRHLELNALDKGGLGSSTLQEKFSQALRLVSDRKIPTGNDLT